MKRCYIVPVILISEMDPFKAKCEAFLFVFLISKTYIELSYIENLLHTVLTWHNTPLAEMHPCGNHVLVWHGSVS